MNGHPTAENTDSRLRRARAALRRRLGPLGVDESFLVFQLLRGRGPGVMLDVGAHFGESLEPFARDRWQVDAFEPDKANRVVLSRSFHHFPNVRIHSVAVSDRPGREALYTSDASSGISSLGQFHPTHTESDTVELVTLGSHLAEYAISSVDFLKIDVEGFEREVLRGYDWSVRPRAVVAEFEDSKTVPRGYAWTDLARTLEARGLRVLVSEWHPIVAYGEAHRWRAFRPYPCELTDPDGWGNLIAVEPSLWAALLRASRRMHGMARIGSAFGRQG